MEGKEKRRTCKGGGESLKKQNRQMINWTLKIQVINTKIKQKLETTTCKVNTGK